MGQGLATVVEAVPGDNMVLWLAYNGGSFSGFQIQPGVRTVQETVEDAVARVADGPVRVAGAGRTDAGVHALGQVVTFPWAGSVPVERLPAALNSALPPDVVVWRAATSGTDFHARFSARAKTYRYMVVIGPYQSPFWQGQALHWAGPLDVGAMAAAADAWVGTHDFSSFQVTGRPVTSAVRTVSGLQVEQAGPLVTVTVSADGFLYKMVRSMVGTLLEIGRGALPPSAASTILASRSRGRAGPTAPAHGLMLWSVDYGPDMESPPAPESLLPFLTPPTRT